MNILVFSQYYEPEPFLIHDKMVDLVNKGNEVTVITGLPNYPHGKVYDGFKTGIISKDGVNIIRLPVIPRKKGTKNLFVNYLSYVIQALFYSKKIENDFDVIYVYQLSPVLMVIPAIKFKKKYKKKMIIYCLDLWPESLVSGGIKKGSLVYNVFKVISKRIYKQADSIHISSKKFADYFDKTLGIKKDFIYNPQYSVLENGTDNVNVDFDTQKINITFTGNMGEMQNLETAIRAMQLVKNDNLVLNLVGDGSKINELKSLVEQFNLNSRIIFHGRKPPSEMYAYIEASDALLLTLKDDEVISYTLPAKVQTYLQSGKFIIGAINGEAAEVIRDADVGVVTPAGNAEKLASSIDDFAKNIKEKSRKGSNGPLYYEKHFGRDKFVEILIKDMERLVQ